jgi:hypothetical protein
MRHVEIQHGKEGLKTQMFNSIVGATSGCTLRLLLDSIADDNKGIKYGIYGDAWFGSVKAASEVARHGHEVVFQIKQNQELFPKAFFEEALKEAPGGAHIVLEGTTQCEIPLIAVGYRYSRKTTLFFVVTKGAGSLVNGNPYEMKLTVSYENLMAPFVDCSQVISSFFQASNSIDTHN